MILQKHSEKVCKSMKKCNIRTIMEKDIAKEMKQIWLGRNHMTQQYNAAIAANMELEKRKFKILNFFINERRREFLDQDFFFYEAF